MTILLLSADEVKDAVEFWLRKAIIKIPITVERVKWVDELHNKHFEIKIATTVDPDDDEGE